MTTATTMTLTPTERAMILWRLEVPDAVVEAIVDECDTFTADDIEASIRRVEAMVRTGRIPPDLTPVGAAVLLDAIDGTTYPERCRPDGTDERASVKARLWNVQVELLARAQEYVKEAANAHA